VTDARVIPLARLFSALFADELTAREARLAMSSDGEGDGRHAWPTPPRETPEARTARRLRQARERALGALLGHVPLGLANVYSPRLRCGWVGEQPVLGYDGRTLVAENGHAVVYEDGLETRYERGRFISERRARVPQRLREVVLEDAALVPTMVPRNRSTRHAGPPRASRNPVRR
jgi:hypothetical protein